MVCVEQINRMTYKDFCEEARNYSTLVYHDEFSSVIQIFVRNSEENYWDIYSSGPWYSSIGKLKSSEPYAVDKYRKIIAMYK